MISIANGRMKAGCACDVKNVGLRKIYKEKYMTKFTKDITQKQDNSAINGIKYKDNCWRRPDQ